MTDLMASYPAGETPKKGPVKVDPQCCHLCSRKQDVGAKVYVPIVNDDSYSGKGATWMPPVIVCEGCKADVKRSKLIEAIVSEGI